MQIVDPSAQRGGAMKGGPCPHRPASFFLTLGGFKQSVNGVVRLGSGLVFL